MSVETKKQIPIGPPRAHTISDVARVRELLSDKPRDLLLFDIATRTGLQMKTILSLRVGDLTQAGAQSRVVVDDRSRERNFSFGIDRVILHGLELHLKSNNLSDDDYLFKSKKGRWALDISTVSRLVKSWFRYAGVSNPGGILALRRISSEHFQISSNDTTVPKPYVKNKRSLNE